MNLNNYGSPERGPKIQLEEINDSFGDSEQNLSGKIKDQDKEKNYNRNLAQATITSTPKVSYKDGKSQEGVYSAKACKDQRVDEDGEIEFDAHPNNDELDTDRHEFYNLNSDRQLKEGTEDFKQFMKGDIEMQNYTQSNFKKSQDTKATEDQDRDGIILPYIGEDDSLIGD